MLLCVTGVSFIVFRLCDVFQSFVISSVLRTRMLTTNGRMLCALIFRVWPTSSVKEHCHVALCGDNDEGAFATNDVQAVRSTDLQFDRAAFIQDCNLKEYSLAGIMVNSCSTMSCAPAVARACVCHKRISLAPAECYK